ncbi:MAG: O-methyltransferase [Eubacterium sp.]|nr:O-methyltransferase [Eubacterium sp.]
MEYSRIRDFIISYTSDDEGLLADICKEAISSDVPIIRREARDFLKTLLYMNRPVRVLEIGTAVGYSTLVMACTLRDIGLEEYHIDTIELDEDRIKQAEKNIGMMNMERWITQYRGDAVEVLEGMMSQGEVNYDFIFIDAAKAQYSAYLELCFKLAHPGTVILTDNVLADGDVLESHFLVEKRDRTIHDRMRQYLFDIMNDERLETSILSVADGMALSVVK